MTTPAIFLKHFSANLAAGPRAKSSSIRSRKQFRRLSFESLEDRRVLATYVVDSLTDAAVTAAGQAPGTLRQAIFDANQDADPDTIVFAEHLAGAVQLAHFDDATYGPSALVISSPVTIQGNAAGIAITRGQFAPSMRLFLVVDGGSLKLESLTVTGGRVLAPANEVGRGGAIYVTEGGNVSVVASTFFDNAAAGQSGRGGAIYNQGGAVSLYNSTFTANSVRSTAGGPAGFGAGIYTLNGALSVYNSTLTEEWSVPGRSVYIIGDGATATLRVYHSILAAPGGGSDIVATYDGDGTIDVRGAYNIVLGAAASLSELGAIVVDPMLDELADNGGPTRTRAFLPNIENHPAIDAGDPNFDPSDPDGDAETLDGLPTDQRGGPFLRVANGSGGPAPRIDIGAYEHHVELTAQPLTGDYNGDGTVNAADYIVWRGMRGRSVLRFAGADGNGDRVIDGLDYQVWKDHYGEKLPQGGGEVAADEFASTAPSEVALAPVAASPTSATIFVSEQASPLAADFEGQTLGPRQAFARAMRGIGERNSVRRTADSPMVAEEVRLAARDGALVLLGRAGGLPRPFRHAGGDYAPCEQDLAWGKDGDATTNLPAGEDLGAALDFAWANWHRRALVVIPPGRPF